MLKEDLVASGMRLVLRERPHPDWTVERANRVMRTEKRDIVAALELAAIPLLSENWRVTLIRRAEKQEPNSTKRLFGENQ